MNPTWIYVGLLYGAAVAILRRFEPLLRRRTATLFYLLVLGFLFRPMTGDWVNVGTDVIELVAPWSIGSHYTKFNVANGMIQDVPLQMVPFAHEVREAWRSGRLPLWQDLTACGGPLMGNGQSAALSPFRLAMLPLSLGHAMTGEAALKLLVALTFTYLYCRRRRYSEWASLIAAASFGFSLFLVVWLHFAMGTAAALLPAVFYSVDLLAERRSASRFAFAAITWATVLLAGHVETAAHMAAITALYAAWMLVVEVQGGRAAFAGVIIGASVAAAILASPFLIALAETILRSRRLADLNVTPYGRIPFSDYPSIFLSLQPRFFGSRPGTFLAPAHAESISGFAGILGVAGFVCALRRAPFGGRWRHVETFFSAAWVLAIVVITDVEWARRLVTALIPFTAHSRMRVVLCWMTALLAGALVDAWRDRAAVLTGVAATAAALLATIARIKMPDAESQHAAITTSIPAFVVLLAACLLLLPRWRRLAFPLLLAAVLVDLWLPGYGWNPSRRTETLYPQRPIIQALQRLDRGRDRFVGMESQLFPNTNAMFGLPDIRHNDPVVSAAYVRVLSLAASYDPTPYYPKWTDMATPLLDFLNVRWIVTMPGVAPPDASRYRMVYDGRDGRIYENRSALPKFFAASEVEVQSDAGRFADALRTNPDWRRTAIVRALPVIPDVAQQLFASHRLDPVPAVTIDAFGTDRYALTVRSPRHALVVSSLPLHPGWRVTSGGRALRAVEANGAFLGFIAPPGTSRVEVSYRPSAIYAAFCASLATLAILLSVAWRQCRRARRGRGAEDETPGALSFRSP